MKKKVSLTIVFLFSLSAEAGDQPANKISFSLPLVNWAWYIPTNHPSLGGENQTDVSDIATLGMRLAYARSFSPYFELEPALEILSPLGLGWGGRLLETRFLLAMRGVLPLADGAFDLTLEAEGGPVVSKLLGLASLSIAATAYLGVRVWVRDRIGLLLSFGTGFLFPATGESGSSSGYATSRYEQGEWQLFRLQLGAAFRF